MIRCTISILVVLVASSLPADEPRAEWIWATKNRQADHVDYFKKTFSVDQEIKTAELRGVVDFSEARMFLNQSVVGELEEFAPLFTLDVTPNIVRGENELVLRCSSVPGPAAFFLRLQLTFQNGSRQTIVTDSSWLNRQVDRTQTKTPVAGDEWKKVLSLDHVSDELAGVATRPVGVDAFDDYTQWKQASSTDKGTDPAPFLIAPGFEIELVRSATKEEGSWVSLAVDPKGRLVIAREERGLLRMTLSKDGREVTRVETINDTLLECRGLLFAFDGLYVNANNSKGFYRLRDTNGDDQFDEVKLLREFPGGVGHGRNDMALGPDDKIYLIHGDSVDVPSGMTDRTSPFRENSRGKKVGEGYMVRTDKDGQSWEIITAGMRNPYGIDFNQFGDAFTYDADAEFDMGSAWYRPTQVKQMVGGGDFGWRGVTGQWPAYYPDHPDNAPPVLDIGKGSPTGVKFGTRGNFPDKYRRALFILDWAYGRILAVHMQPRGASYLCVGETFLKGRPLNVTDLDFGLDGAMYFVTGGRQTQAALYRVRYVGPAVDPPPPTTFQQYRDNYALAARNIRRRLEKLHGQQDRTILPTAWQHLSSADPSIRYAARIAVEHQPVETWSQRALAEKHPTAATTALLALARSQDEASKPKILPRLVEFPLDQLSLSQQLAALYVCELCLSKPETLDAETKLKLIGWLDAGYPHLSPRVNTALSHLLVALNAPGVVSKTIQLLSATTDQNLQFHFLYVLRNVRDGWTPSDRETYFHLLRETKYYLGGEGMTGFLQKIRDEAVATLTDAEKEALAPLLKIESTEETPAVERPFVQKWTVDEIADSLEQLNETRDVERGRAMFLAANCHRCHRVGREGTLVGPDLTFVRSRFSRRDLLESIVAPSKVIADNYQTVRVVTTDGKVYSGRIVPGGDYRSPQLRLATNPNAPHEVTEIDKINIETQSPSPISWMPEGLLNTLSKDEILDLLAFIESGGVIARNDAKDGNSRSP